MRTIMNRCENFAAAVAEAKAGKRNGYLSYRAIARKYKVNHDTLKRNCDSEYRERRNALYRVKPKPTVAVQTTIESVNWKMVPPVFGNGLVPVSLPRVRFLEGPP